MAQSSSHPAAQARVIALDVGGTSVKSAVTIPGGRVLGAVKTTPIDSAVSADEILGTLAAVISGHLSQVEAIRPAGIAFGFPGPFEYAEGICRITGVEKFEGLYGLNLRQALQRRLRLGDLPMLFRNDAEAAIVGEARYGAGRRFQRLIGVTLGTGFGSAYTVAGKAVVSGPGVPAQGWLYPVPWRGVRADDCFSSRGLFARLQAAGTAWAGVKLAADAARGTDSAARRVFEEFGADLGRFLNSFVEAFRAEAVLVAGQISGAFDLFGPALLLILSVPALKGERGNEAALLGAAELIFDPQADIASQKRTST